MNNIVDIIFPYDLARLPKEKLVEIAPIFDLATNVQGIILADGIWDKIKGDNASKQSILHIIRETIFCGRSCITWYRLTEQQKNLDLKKIFTTKLTYNPFEEIKVSASSQGIVETILGGVDLGDSKYLLRYIVKTGIHKVSYGTEIITQPLTSMVTIYIDQQKGFIEVRCDSKAIKKTETMLGNIIGSSTEEVIERISIRPYAENIGDLAQVLGGVLIETNSIPDKILKTLQEDQIRAIVNALRALDCYFDDGESDRLLEDIQSSKNVLETDEEFIGIPFTAIVLAGMHKLGLSLGKESECDLKNHPLFATLNPYLQHQNGFIRFKAIEDGVEQRHTIKVGMSSDSVSFWTFATEKAIETIRQKLGID